MKILIICQYYYPEPFRISDICETLSQNGHEVTVLTGLPNYPEGQILKPYRKGRKRKELINGVKVIRAFEFGRGKGHAKLFLNYFSFVLSASFKALFMKEEFDVIFVNQLSPVMMAIPAIIYKKRHNKKILLYCLDLWPESLVAGGVKKGSIVYNFFLKVSKWIYKTSDKIFVTSGMFKEYFEHNLLMSTNNIEHLPQYAEDLFAQNIYTKKDDKYHFVFAGNVGEIQSVETIIKAANELRNTENIQFHIVGDGSALEKCKQYASGFNLTDITFYGRLPVEQMPQFYGMASAMLITLKDDAALSYTLPGKVQSYMAAGKPIIAAINGETRRVINEAECGMCCDAEDYKQLANLIIMFCNSEEKEIMAKNAKAYYIERYSKEKFFTRLEYALIELGC